MDISQTVAVTGATGFVGKTLVQQLLAAGHKVRALSRKAGGCRPHRNLLEINGSLEDREALARLVTGSDSLVHLAAAIAGRNRHDFVRVNAAGTRQLVETMEQVNAGCRLIHVSSLAARAPQLSDYARSKHLAEQVVQSSHLTWIIVRPPAVYGPHDPALAALWRALARGWLIQTGSDQARFSLLHVDDLCAAVAELIRQPWPSGRTLWLDDGRQDGYAWKDLADLAARRRDRQIRTLKLSRRLLALIATVNQLAGRATGRVPLLNPGKVRELTHPDWVCGNNVAQIIPDWRPEQQLERALGQLPGWSQLLDGRARTG
ncbi:MAG: NAD-dependent epimerase/dehydratase family protein [Wenzhouxiangella sp.]